MLPKCRDGLFHKITEWCIKYGAKKKLINCLNLPNNALILYFDKLTGKITIKKLQNFSFCGSISLMNEETE